MIWKRNCCAWKTAKGDRTDDFNFRIEIQKLLVDEKYWSKYDWMNNATANEIVVYELGRRIRKHPILWKLFFKLVS